MIVSLPVVITVHEVTLPVMLGEPACRGLTEALEDTKASSRPQAIARADPPYEITAVNTPWTLIL